jgi:hypothetical protein
MISISDVTMVHTLETSPNKETITLVRGKSTKSHASTTVARPGKAPQNAGAGLETKHFWRITLGVRRVQGIGHEICDGDLLFSRFIDPTRSWEQFLYLKPRSGDCIGFFWTENL